MVLDNSLTSFNIIGIKYLEQALLIGTDDQKLLASIYSQLGKQKLNERDD
jgi:hypothetical protein